MGRQREGRELVQGKRKPRKLRGFLVRGSLGMLSSTAESSIGKTTAPVRKLPGSASLFSCWIGRTPVGGGHWPFETIVMATVLEQQKQVERLESLLDELQGRGQA